MFYKNYRENIRTKINLLSAISAGDQLRKISHLQQAELYPKRMKEHLDEMGS